METEGEAFGLGLHSISKNGKPILTNVTKKDEYFWKLFHDNKWEENTFKVFDHFLSPNYYYLDIGAWIGPTVLYGTHTAKGVFAFEPDKEAFRRLFENVSLNANIKDKVRLYNIGVSNINKIQEFYVGDGASSGSSTIKSGANSWASYDAVFKDMEHIVPMMGVDIRDVNFIKIDIEGGEYELIPSLLRYFKRNDYYPDLFLSLPSPYLNKSTALDSNKKLISLLQNTYPYLYSSDFSAATLDTLCEIRFQECIATKTAIGKKQKARAGGG